VTILELLRNDDVERLADRFGSGVTEGRLGPGVPEANRPFSVRDDDGVGTTLGESAVQRCARFHLGPIC